MTPEQINKVQKMLERAKSQAADIQTKSDIENMLATLASFCAIKEALDALSAPAQSDAEKDAARYRKAIALEDNAELLYAAVLNHGPDKQAIDAEFDAAIQAERNGE